MPGDVAIHHLGGGLGLGRNPFGRDVANLALYRALARHGGFDTLHMLTALDTRVEDVTASLSEGAPLRTRVEVSSLLDLDRARKAGVLFRGKADLSEMAWSRREAGPDEAYSLVGLIHTLAPPTTREEIAAASLAPTQPWDAIICTSPAVQAAMRHMFEGWTGYLADRFGGGARPIPQLALLPLGVDAAVLRGQADRPDVRAAARGRLGLAEDDVLVLWVGRLSFYEKATPQPMFQAVEAAGAASGRRMAFALAGWFPQEAHKTLFEEAARTYAPTTAVHWIDGNDAVALGEMWAAADIFLSLVDNIQETFGLAPVEAMAAGLPVVASDWDGYRYTIEHGVQGFLAPTMTPSPGPPSLGIARRHLNRMDTYQSYVGQLAQFTAVDVGAASRGLAALAGSRELRKAMGEAGRARVAAHFDWPVVARAYAALFEDLARARPRGGEVRAPRTHPVHGDPFADFAGFATARLDVGTRLSVAEGVDPATHPALAGGARLDDFASARRLPAAQLRPVVEDIARRGAPTVLELLTPCPVASRAQLTYSLAWLCKMGVLSWS